MSIETGFQTSKPISRYERHQAFREKDIVGGTVWFSRWKAKLTRRLGTDLEVFPAMLRSDRHSRRMERLVKTW